MANRPFNVFNRPPPNFHMGQAPQDPTLEAVQSNYRVSGGNIYQGQDPAYPMNAEVNPSPITDPNIANAVSRITYQPQQAYVTRTPEAMVAQPFTYEKAARAVAPGDYQVGTSPEVFLAFQPPPIQRNDILPQEGQVTTIPSPGRLAIDGGMMLPPPSELHQLDPLMEQWSLEQAYANEMMRIEALRARANNGTLTAAGPLETITTPTTTGATIPRSTAPPAAPTPPFVESLANIIHRKFQKTQGALATPDQIAPEQLRPEMVPTQQIPVRPKMNILGLPIWVWLVAAGGAYLAFKGK